MRIRKETKQDLKQSIKSIANGLEEDGHRIIWDLSTDEETALLNTMIGDCETIIDIAKDILEGHYDESD